LESAVREGGASSEVHTDSFTFPNDGNWHHIAITYNNGDVILYLDGHASSTLETGFGELKKHSSKQSFGNSMGDAFGEGQNKNYYNGLMDDIRHYNSVLSPQDVLSLSKRCDDDGDGIPNRLDLDSDNDGIPDNVEAQSTSGYVAPSGNDTDGDGLDDAYDPDNGGTSLTPPDTDKDGIPDYLDSDSDNDGYTDCEEGLPDSTGGKSCPVSASAVNANGVIDWADGTGGAYSDPNLKVDDPSSDLFNETGDTSEVGYREFLCGKGRIYLTAYRWRLISLPCDTGNNEVQDVFSQLGTYGDNYVVYKQTGADNYEVDSNHPNTDKSQLNATDTLEQGISYWIISDADHNVTIDKTLGGLSPTPTQDTGSLSISDEDFDKAAQFQLPNNSNAKEKKYMAGNPFPYSFDLGNVYFRHGSGSFNPMGASANDSYINATVYKHDSNETGPVTGYEAVTPSTPGFNAPIHSMEGFFVKLPSNSDTSNPNSFAYPLTYGNDR